MKEIELTQGKTALVDDDDIERLTAIKWCAHKTRSGHWYAVGPVRVGGAWKVIKMHRYILNAPKGVMVDHRDGNGLNNQRTNLRLCSGRQNNQNMRPRIGTSAYKGVSRHAYSPFKWIAQISTTSGKRVNLGSFAKELDAARAYDSAAIKHYGEFANLNFPIEGDAP